MACYNKSGDIFSNYKPCIVPDENNLLFIEPDTPNAKRIEGVARLYENASNIVKEVIVAGEFPVVLAADHSSAGATIAGIKGAFPDKKLGVIWIDAHADMHSPYTTPSGNIHGMPLATALAQDNEPCRVNDISELEYTCWEAMKNTQGVAPKISPDNLVLCGVRATEYPEDRLIESLKIKNFSVEETRSLGVAATAKQALTRLTDCDIIYISFDVDSMDPSISKGTGTPVPNGYSVEEVTELILKLLESEKVQCFEMVEINPLLDENCNLMAEVAYSVLEKVVEKVQVHDRTVDCS